MIDIFYEKVQFWIPCIVRRADGTVTACAAEVDYAMKLQQTLGSASIVRTACPGDPAPAPPR